MPTGSLDTVRPQFVHKTKIHPGARPIVLGGPGMLIRLSVGAALSQAQGTGDAVPHFASVQRENVEMQRQCQQVIDVCMERCAENPIACNHDVDTGGLSNALPGRLRPRCDVRDSRYAAR